MSSNPQLNAIPTSVTPISVATTPAPEEEVTFNPIPYLIGDRLRSVLIAAVSGGGKDILLSNAIREFLTRYPDFTVVVMDCKADPKETGYYANLPGVTVYRLDVSTAPESTALAWIDAALDDFNNRGEKALLVCNEGTAIRALSKRYADVVSSFVSNGDSRQKYAWEAGQSGHTEDLKTNGPGRSRFRPLAIALQGEEMQVEAILQAKWFAETAKDLRVIETEMRRSPVNRAWTDGRRWYPMPELPNYSGYDRDSRSFVHGEPPVSSENVGADPSISPLLQPPATEPSRTLYDELANDFDETGAMPMMGDFIRWLKTKRTQVLSKRNVILLWGNKKNRGITSNELVQPFLAEAIELGLLKQTEDGYRVIDT